MKGNDTALIGRRLVVGLATLLWTSAACWFLVPHLFRPAVTDTLDLLANFVFVLLMFTGSFNFTLYVVGFICRNAHPRAEDLQAVATKTAIVMPVYNEDMDRIFLGLQQTWLSAKQAGL